MALGEPPRGLITAIQHFCIHDGPGTRTVVFFKGCPLRCAWCQNPETWSRAAQHFFKPHLCLGCRRCVETCAEAAMTAPGQRNDACEACFRCADACPGGGLSRVGSWATVEELFQAIRPEIPYLLGSDGGVTLSGGEPAWAEPRLAAQLARRLGDEGLRVALETCGQVRLGPEGSGAARELIAAVDLVLLDLKLFDDEASRRWCGASSEPVKATLRTLVQEARTGQGPPIWPRLTLVPGVTDRAANLVGWARLLRSLGISWLTLIPFHRLGEPKRSWLGLPLAPEFEAQTDETASTARALLEGEGILCFEPGEEEWGVL
jgi:pyruvate formate lyase activating enzyme